MSRPKLDHCACGCGQRPGPRRKFVDGHRKRPRQMVRCAYAKCGALFVPRFSTSRYHTRSCSSRDRRAQLRVAGAKGGRKAGAARRRAFVERTKLRLLTETKPQAYKRGRLEGWKAGYAAATLAVVRRDPDTMRWLKQVTVHDLEAWAQRGVAEMAS